jgi:hypothetical protein
VAEGLRFGSLLIISFQRFKRPRDGVIDVAPASLGALPVGASESGELLLPLADDEAFWMGLTPYIPATVVELAVRVELKGYGLVDAFSGERCGSKATNMVRIPPVTVIDGIRRADRSFLVFSRGTREQRLHACHSVQFIASEAGRDDAGSTAAVRLVDYAAFAELTKSPPPSPLDPDAGYKGWQLP